MIDLTRFPVVPLLKKLSDVHGELQFNLFSPLPVKPIQDRIGPDRTGVRAVERALSLRESTGLPFWDCANLACFGLGESSQELIKQALFHNDTGLEQWKCRLDDLTGDWIMNRLDSLEDGRILVLSSRVDLPNSQVMHIPMMDFHCPINPSNTRLIDICLATINMTDGWILSSGKSYHFYGSRLFSQEELFRFLSKCLLLSPITDRAWIAHQFLEGSCGLRVSKRSSDLRAPHIIAELSGSTSSDIEISALN